jgi:hypothetical protein
LLSAGSNRDQQRDDPDHHQQLDQGKTIAPPARNERHQCASDKRREQSTLPAY